MTALAAAPFAAILLSLALLPQVAPRLWHAPWRRGAWLLLLTLPAAVLEGTQHPARLLDSCSEFVGFVALLGALYVAAAAIVIHTHFSASPKTNLLLLGLGSLLASFVGTTGASMLLVRPLLQSNRSRRYTHHTVVFFIFMVSNVGGLLLPLGDPPLFLGYLHGVPFAWTLRLLPAWGMVLGALLLIYAGLETWLYAKEAKDGALSAKQAAPKTAGAAMPSVHVEGFWALASFAALMAIMLAAHPFRLSQTVQQLAMLAVLAITFVRTPKHRHVANHFQWAPMVEVAQIFAAIFVAMPAALDALAALHDWLPLSSSNGFFWATGVASSLLDNAPCYLSFATLAATHLGLPSHNLAQLAASPAGAPYLEAIALGAVTMGAATYVGNGPNLMVRSLAEAHKVRAPSFFAYVLWSCLTLVPVLACTQALLYTARHTSPSQNTAHPALDAKESSHVSPAPNPPRSQP